MKKFYKQAAVAAADAGWQVVLDGRPIKTPAKAVLIVPSEALAQAVAGEWQDQGEIINPKTMALTQLANTAQDRVVPRRDDVVTELARYGETDLLCYHAGDEPALAAQQAEHWAPILDWLADQCGARPAVSDGIMPISQPQAVITYVKNRLGELDGWVLTAAAELTSGFGSVFLTLYHLDGHADAEALWRISALEFAHQQEKWGFDAEAAATQDTKERATLAAARFLALLRS